MRARVVAFTMPRLQVRQKKGSVSQQISRRLDLGAVFTLFIVSKHDVCAGFVLCPQKHRSRVNETKISQQENDLSQTARSANRPKRKCARFDLPDNVTKILTDRAVPRAFADPRTRGHVANTKPADRRYTCPHAHLHSEARRQENLDATFETSQRPLEILVVPPDAAKLRVLWIGGDIA